MDSNSNSMQGSYFAYNLPVNQQEGQRRPAFGTSYQQGQKSGFFARPQNEYVRPAVTAISSVRNHQDEEYGPNKMRRMGPGQHVQARFQPQAQMRFNDSPNNIANQHAQMKDGSRTQGLHYSNVLRISKEERLMSQETVNDLTQACLTEPLSDDEAQLLASKSASDDNESVPFVPFMKANEIPIAKKVTTPQIFSQVKPPSQIPSKKGPSPQSQQSTNSALQNSSQVPLTTPDLELKMEAIEAILARHRIKSHTIIRDIFDEVKSDLKQWIIENSHSNGKQT